MLNFFYVLLWNLYQKHIISVVTGFAITAMVDFEIGISTEQSNQSYEGKKKYVYDV